MMTLVKAPIMQPLQSHAGASIESRLCDPAQQVELHSNLYITKCGT